VATVSQSTLFYLSESASGITWEDAVDLARHARSRNLAEGITGVLVFDGTTFVQFVNGPEKATSDLLARLRFDPRHRLLDVFSKPPGAGLPHFDAWGLTLLQPLPGASLAAIRGLDWSTAFARLAAALPEGSIMAT